MGDSNKVHISFIITNVSTNNPFTGYRTHFNSEKGLFPSHCIEITIDNMKRGCTPPFQCWSPSCALACPHFDAGLPPVPSCTSILMPVGGDLPPAPLHLSISTPDSLMRQGGHPPPSFEQFTGPQVSKSIKTCIHIHQKPIPVLIGMGFCGYGYGFAWNIQGLLVTFPRCELFHFIRHCCY